jgi:hypothetical protein
MSPRPWKIRRSFGGYVDAIVDRDGEAVCYGTIADSDADAIVACVNACDGIDTELLTPRMLGDQIAAKMAVIDRTEGEARQMKVQLDDLLHELRRCVNLIAASGINGAAQTVADARAAIARAVKS